MLSLLSLIIASGQVLKTDTNPWEADRFPDPRINFTECGLTDYSTLCDPDRILTDLKRSTLKDTVAKHEKLFGEAEVAYVDQAKEICLSNVSESAQIFVILAKQIQTSSNNSITSDEMVKFGNDLRFAYGLESRSCKNYAFVVYIKSAKDIYVWIGSDLALTQSTIDTMLEKYKHEFNETGNIMEGISQIINDIGELMLNPLRDVTTTPIPTEMETLAVEEATTITTVITPAPERVIPGWIYIIIAMLVLAVVLISAGALWYIRRGISHNIHPLSEGKMPHFEDVEKGSQFSNNIQQRSMTIITHDERVKSDSSTSSNNNSPSHPAENAEQRSLDSRISSRRNSLPITQAAYNIINKAADTVLLRSSGYFSSNEDTSSIEEEKKHDSKVAISPIELTTDVVLARRHSETMPHPARMTDQFSSF